MGSPLVQASLKAPGFLGLNTEQSSAQQQERFATELENAVFDEAGKIVCRKGYSVLADGGPDSVDRVFVWRKDDSTKKLLAVGDAAGTATVYEMDETTVPYDTFTSHGTLNSTDVQFVNCNGFAIIVEDGQNPRYWSGGAGNFQAFAAATGTTANPKGGVALSAFGRLFIVSEDGKTLHASELQPDPSVGINWDNWFIDTTGNSGASAKDGWVIGRDFITAVSAIDDLLIIWGSESILLFTDVNGTVALADSISGVGCVNHRTVQHIGDDVLFRSANGLRSLRRTLERETPQLNDASAYVRSDFVDVVQGSASCGVFHHEAQFYLIGDNSHTYYFDTRQKLPGGALRACTWSLNFNDASYDIEDGELFFAIGDAVCKYTGYTDDAATYKLMIKSAWLDFGQQAIKILKKLAAIIYKGDGYQPKFYYAFDWNRAGEELVFGEALPVITGSEWNVAEWGIGEWGGDLEHSNLRTVQGSGSGLFVRYGLEFTVNGFEVGIHEVRVLCKIGKLAHV